MDVTETFNYGCLILFFLPLYASISLLLVSFVLDPLLCLHLAMMSASAIGQTENVQRNNLYLQESFQTFSSPARFDYDRIDMEAQEQNSFNDDNDESVDCSICLESISPGQRANRTRCGHWNHSQCLMEWIQQAQQPTCPVCRAPL